MNAGIENEVPLFLHLRREPFEYGLLPLPQLMFADGIATLKALRAKLIQHSFTYSVDNSVDVSSANIVLEGDSESFKRRVNTIGIAESLQLAEEHARVILETLASVLPDYGQGSDPLAHAACANVDSVGVDIDDLLIFLYIQTYKRLLPRPHKDAASVADVWPSTSVFDGFLSTLSPLQLVRSGRRFMPSQADEETYQVSYVQKHLLNILALLAEPSEGEDNNEVQVLSSERFEHLGLLLHVGERGAEAISLSQAAPFFANSDPNMPAVPVPVVQVFDWTLQHICGASDRPFEKVITTENGSPDGGDLCITKVDACTTVGGQSGTFPNGTAQQRKAFHPDLTFVEGVTKASVVKLHSDIEGSSVKVLNCHDSVIYILAPLNYVTINGCSDAIVVIGAVGKAVRVEHCERVQVIVAAKHMCISNCRECVFFLGVNNRPIISGDNHKIQVAPYNTFYPDLELHLAHAGVDPTINKWDTPLALGMVDPHDSLSHPAGVSDGQAESATVLPPDRFLNFVIPKWFGVESGSQLTKDNPFILPKAYMVAYQQKCKSLEDMRLSLRNASLEDSKRRELANAIHTHFKEWLYSSGNIRQLYCLQNSESDSRGMD